MKWILFLCCLGTLAAAAPPVSPAPVVPTEPERYLFLVETSEGMRKLDQSSRQALFDVIYWGVDGHMVGGDTYGLWTFNEEVQSGIFPMQIFDPSLQLPLATRASLFLKDQPYENKTDMGHLVLKLLSVVIAVKDVNLFIITDGTQPIVGLRFDNEIKAACESRMKEARRAKKPFIICLAARGGDIHSWSLTLPGEQVQLPDRRATVPKPKVVVASVTTSNEVPRAVVPSIMMTSSRPRPGVITEQKQPVRANVSEVAPLEPSPIGETTADESSPVANRANATTQSRTIGTPELTVRRDAALAAAAVAEAEILRRVSRQQSAQQLAKASNAPTQPTQPAKAPLPAAAEEMIVAAREPGIVPGAVIPGATRLAAPLLSGKELLIAGIILLLIATGLVFILFRWSNPVTHGSYITRSMDR